MLQSWTGHRSEFSTKMLGQRSGPNTDSHFGTFTTPSLVSADASRYWLSKFFSTKPVANFIEFSRHRKESSEAALGMAFARAAVRFRLSAVSPWEVLLLKNLASWV
jgi:hypothetical protein